MAALLYTWYTFQVFPRFTWKVYQGKVACWPLRTQGLALIGVYLGILTFAQSLSHALEQLSQNQVWVGLVAMNAPHAMAGDTTPA
ncbi:MAG: hypothetical protein HY871_07840 [Chloroflexi bacterium]|nr:hypothetical protein [Chloroflexota bacterium]